MIDRRRFIGAGVSLAAASLLPAEANETEKAIANYQRSLELDPNNANAVKMIEKLRSTK